MCFHYIQGSLQIVILIVALEHFQGGNSTVTEEDYRLVATC